MVLPDKDAFIVVYCSNTACQNSAIASRRLVELGYTSVHEYIEGKQDWIEVGYRSRVPPPLRRSQLPLADRP